MSIYLHKKSNMTGFAGTNITNTYDSDYLGKISPLYNKLVDTKNIFIVDAKDNDWNNPKEIEIPENGTYRFTVLFGASRTNSTRQWYNYLGSGGIPATEFFYVFAMGNYSNGDFAALDDILPGYVPYPEFGASLRPKIAENYRQGKYKDFILTAGTLKIGYMDNGYGDNEGSIIYHIEKIA